LDVMTDGGQLASFTIAVAMLLMVFSGTSKRMLAWRFTRRRRCDACHHEVRDCTCRH